MVRFLFMLLFLTASAASAESLKLAPEEALERAQQGEIAFVDIRLPFEWAETGLPEAAEGISLQDETLQPRQGFIDDLIALVDGDRSLPIALICARGNRSAFAQKLLAANGFTAVLDVTEGMVGGPNGPGWIGRGLPTVPCEAC
ncbi:MAG: rhodanese-like domain-containing protein [Pseudomonadota bacterium]